MIFRWNASEFLHTLFAKVLLLLRHTCVFFIFSFFLLLLCSIPFWMVLFLLQVEEKNTANIARYMYKTENTFHAHINFVCGILFEVKPCSRKFQYLWINAYATISMNFLLIKHFYWYFLHSRKEFIWKFSKRFSYAKTLLFQYIGKVFWEAEKI